MHGATVKITSCLGLKLKINVIICLFTDISL